MPGLPGTRLEVWPAGESGVSRRIGTSGPARLETSHFTWPDGTQVVRAEQTVVPNVETRRWDFQVSATGTRLLGTERRITLTDGSLVAIPVGSPNQPVTHLDANGTVIEHGPPVRVGDAGINIPTATGFQLYDPATGALSHTGLRLTGPDGHPSAAHVMTPNDGGGARTLVGDDATTVLGSVTAPPNAHGVLHVTPAGTGPTITVFGPDGRFSHHSLALTGIDELGVPGGFIRIPNGNGLPHLVDAEGKTVPETLVVPQLLGGYRIEHTGGQFHVDASGVRVHDVVPLTADGDRPELYVFTPVGAVDPLPVPRGEDGGAPLNAVTVSHVDGTLHVTALGNEVNVHTRTAPSHTPRCRSWAAGARWLHSPARHRRRATTHARQWGRRAEHERPASGPRQLPGGAPRRPDHRGRRREAHARRRGAHHQRCSAQAVRAHAGRCRGHTVAPSARPRRCDRREHHGYPGRRRAEAHRGQRVIHRARARRHAPVLCTPRAGGAFNGRFVRSDAQGATLVDAGLIPVPERTPCLNPGCRTTASGSPVAAPTSWSTSGRVQLHCRGPE
ncbi:hypothetical protein NKH18_15145 [Streptomyces sp. M10(2022)]